MSNCSLKRTKTYILLEGYINKYTSLKIPYELLNIIHAFYCILTWNINYIKLLKLSQNYISFHSNTFKYDDIILSFEITPNGTKSNNNVFLFYIGVVKFPYNIQSISLKYNLILKLKSNNITKTSIYGYKQRLRMFHRNIGNNNDSKVNTFVNVTRSHKITNTKDNKTINIINIDNLDLIQISIQMISIKKHHHKYVMYGILKTPLYHNISWKLNKDELNEYYSATMNDEIISNNEYNKYNIFWQLSVIPKTNTKKHKLFNVSRIYLTLKKCNVNKNVKYIKLFGILKCKELNIGKYIGTKEISLNKYIGISLINYDIISSLNNISFECYLWIYGFLDSNKNYVSNFNIYSQ